ncbi:MAG: hypothetical protein M1815_005417 [Lichina confinis]|nr:MAG: hypothetical protein M1815_005417 [Lichina confinis]
MSAPPIYVDQKVTEPAPVVGPTYPQQTQPVYQAHTHAAATTAAGPAQPWANSFWDCLDPLDLCFLSYCCPCIVFGRTQQRVVDPQLENYETVNTDCLIWYGLSCVGVQWLYQMIKRTEFRERFNLEGSQGMDCFGSYCCLCCELMQSEKEARYRLLPGGATAQGYRKNDTMVPPGGSHA